MLRAQTLLFPTDDSASAEAARPLAERLARRHGATLHILRVEVVPPVADLRFDPAPEADQTAEGVVEARRRFPSAADAILLYADEIEADLIVMGTHGRTGFNRLTLGSTTERVIRRAPCAVLTVGPESETEAHGPVLAPLAFESASDTALETAVAVAEAEGRRVVALHVVEPIDIPVPYLMTLPPFDPEDLTGRVEQTMARWATTYAERVPVGTEVRLGNAAARILDVAGEINPGLIVQASHGRRGLERWLLGSVAEAIVRKAPCPVLTLRVGARSLVAADDRPGLAVPRPDWPDLFDALSRHATTVPHEVSVEVISPDATGTIFRSVPLVGITYDPRSEALDVIAESGEHHIVHPFAIRSEAGAWVLDGALDPDAPGPWVLDVVGADGTRQRVTVRPVATTVPA